MSLLFVVALFLCNFFTSASEAEVTVAKVAYLVCTSLFIVYTFFYMFWNPTNYVGYVVRRYQRVLVIAVMIIIYTFSLALFRGYSLYDWMTDFWSFIPLLLSFNFACLFRKKEEWLRIFALVIILGVAASLRDFGMHTIGTGRMATEEFANVDFFVAASLCIGFLIYPLNKFLFLLSLASLPVLLLRVVMTGNRSMVVLLALFVLALFLKRLFAKRSKGPRVTRKVLRVYTLALVAASIVAGLLVIGGNAVRNSLGLFNARFQSTTVDKGVDFRMIEAGVVWSKFREHPLGAGFGSSEYFPGTGTASFTANVEPYKGYVHNMLLYCMWKLGIFGILLCVILAVLLVKAMKWTWANEDPLPFIIWLVVAQYAAYSMVETYYRRHDYNLIIGIAIGFLVYASRSKFLDTVKAKVVRKDGQLAHTWTNAGVMAHYQRP